MRIQVCEYDKLDPFIDKYDKNWYTLIFTYIHTYTHKHTAIDISFTITTWQTTDTHRHARVYA